MRHENGNVKGFRTAPGNPGVLESCDRTIPDYLVSGSNLLAGPANVNFRRRVGKIDRDYEIKIQVNIRVLTAPYANYRLLRNFGPKQRLGQRRVTCSLQFLHCQQNGVFQKQFEVCFRFYTG